MKNDFGSLRWVGSKGNVARDLRSMSPLDGFDEYREIFAGSAAMLGQIPRDLPRTICDVFPFVVNFLRAVRDEPYRIIEPMERLKDALRRDIDELYHAFYDAKFQFVEGCPLALLVLTRYSYGQNVGLHRNDIASFAYAHMRDGLDPITPERIMRDHEILQGVDIRQCDYWELMRQPAKGKSCLIMADPPYDVVGHSCGLYNHAFTDQQQLELRDRIVQSPHWVVATVGISPLTEDLYLDCGLNIAFKQYLYCSINRQSYSQSTKRTYSDGTVYKQPKRLEMVARNFRNAWRQRCAIRCF